jgi:hypothetical protein
MKTLEQRLRDAAEAPVFQSSVFAVLGDLRRDLLTAAETIKGQRMALERAVNPHAFNCGFVKHPDFVKMVPVDGCNCGLDVLMEITGPGKS